MTLTASPTRTTLAETAPTVLSLIAGYVGHRTVAIGLRTGLVVTGLSDQVSWGSRSIFSEARD